MIASSIQYKAEAALKTIGEVGEVLSLPTHVIRFWESRFPQIKPMKHNNRRYYTPQDIAVIKLIKDLLYEQGYTIKGVLQYFEQNKLSLSSINYLSLEEESELTRLKKVYENLRLAKTKLAAMILE